MTKATTFSANCPVVSKICGGVDNSIRETAGRFFLLSNGRVFNRPVFSFKASSKLNLNGHESFSPLFYHWIAQNPYHLYFDFHYVSIMDSSHSARSAGCDDVARHEGKIL